MSIRRVAIIYDDQVRPDTTGVYCRRVLSRLVEVEQVIPGELGRLQPGRFDLYLNIDDGLRYRLPERLRPAAWWAIDTHLDPDWYREKGPDFDLVFAAQRDGADRLRQEGIGSARWLPLACDPELHRPHEVEELYDICFVGHLFPGARSELVRVIQRRFPQSFVGQRFFEVMAETYSASRIVFNRSLRNDINMRVFEALGCGSLLLTNDLASNGQAELFRDGVHLATYRDAEEMLDKIAFYLVRDEARRRIAARGREEALAQHTYRHRMEAILRAAEALESSISIPVGERPTPSPSSGDEPGVTSIVILTHGQLEATQACLESIRRCTPEPYELIVVDNASSDDTVAFLETQADVRLIANAENRGFPAGANQGIGLATGRQVLLLNNDTVVTPGWLTRLLRAHRTDPRIGLVGPCSNCVSGPQQVPAEYDSLDALDAFAEAWGVAHDGRLEDVDRLVGFCLLIRREVIDAIGVLDERFGPGCFEDDDYVLRAIRAGFRAVIARDAFVHHEGSRTFRAAGIDFNSLMRENERRFLEKWSGEPASVTATDTAPGRYAVSVSSSGGLVLSRSHVVKLSLCMIVRDNEGTLPACLESIRPWVDEMVIVDTGSTDGTPRIAEVYGGRLFHFPWCDDFSAARNESFRHARGEWIFWMDSDDTISPECGLGLRALACRATASEVLGYVMQVHCPGGNDDGAYDVTAVDHVKLIRNRPDLRFDGRIHEQLLPAIRRAGGDVAWTDLYVVHSGSDPSPEARERKRRRDLRLLELELAERPEHPFTLFNLGMTHSDGEEYERAAEYLVRGIARAGRGDSHLRKAYALLAHALMALKRYDEASETCRYGLELFPGDGELRFRQGVLFHEIGRLDEAERAFRDVLETNEGRHFRSIDLGIHGFKARQNLAVVYADRGDLEASEGQWRAITGEVPGYRRGWRGLGEVLVWRGRLEEAASLADRLEGDPALVGEAALLRGRLTAARGEVGVACREFVAAVGARPDDAEVRDAQCRFLFEHGDLDEAERAVRELLRLLPKDGATWHNLGTLLHRARRHDEAAESFRESLRHRPDSAVTYLGLGRALREAGRPGPAVEAWHQAWRLAPGDPAVADELERSGAVTTFT